METYEELKQSRDQLRAEHDEYKKLFVQFDGGAMGLALHLSANDQLRVRVTELEAVIGNARSLAYGAPELNMSNYDHEQVRQLNDAMCEVFTTLDAAIDAARLTNPVKNHGN